MFVSVDVLGCQSSDSRLFPTPAVTIPELQHSDPCSQLLKAASVSCDLGAFTLATTCEEVSVKVALPWGPVKIFEKLTAKEGGELTMFTGLEASIGVAAIGGGVSGGFYITENTKWDEITDFGFKVERSIRAGPISCNAGKLEIGVAGAIKPDL